MRRAARRALGPGLLALGLALVPGVRAAPEDELELVASREGFRPALVKLRRGESVRLLLSSADGEHCFALDALRVEKRIVPGRATPLELYPERAGSYAFYCCLDPDEERERGRLVVAD